MKNRAEMTLGSLTSTFVATIIIIVILLLFVAVSGLVKLAGNIESGTRVDKESQVGLESFSNYFDSFSKFVNFRFLIGKGKMVDVALKEAGYG